ncbi:MAG: tetratricopeptide repeat protein [Candidatus Scalindua sp.]|jgi:tetratricopeptide (TPR) repeat protein|nr:tetratricopeptide repeat protein [Candidatus Scalindua sp.]MBT7213276.1 tetratricopeptide repeat protein [Candidatus Scalindua sp.]MBT7592528.1 tetratricopeptide repeat protein [Candidatus Scalindua sp.]
MNLNKKNKKDLLQEALKLHQAGNLGSAAKCYNKLLEMQPNNIDALFLSGTLNLQSGKLDLACLLFRKALELEPGYAMAHGNLGTALQESGRFEEAIASYRQAIALRPDYTDAHYNLGNTFKAQGKLEEAVVCYRKSIQLKPDYIDAYGNLGNTLREQGKHDEAIECYRQVTVLKPDCAVAHSNLGSVLQESGKLDEALSCQYQAIELKPDYAEAHNNLGIVLKELGRFDDAIKSHNLSIKLKPDYAEAHNNLGVSFMRQDKPDKAMACYRRAIELKPDYAEAHNNLGTVLQGTGKPEESIASYERAITLKPDYAQAHLNRSFALLLTEKLEEGWHEYEWRLHIKGHTIGTDMQPMWDGKPLNGKSILIQTEQGFGDIIQFVRYLPMVKAQGGRVTIECSKSLFRLLENCSGIDGIIETTPGNESSEQFDVHVPLLSLPGIFGTKLDSIPSDNPYILIDPILEEHWRIRLDDNNNPKIGIVWAGNHHHKNDRNRSCTLADFANLSSIPGISFYSLQKGPASIGNNNSAEGMNIINLENELDDFADTAAVIANLDIVISVDTAVVHLSGAIGKPVWTLLPFDPDWRWLLNREDSPWYPGMRLFRQLQPNDWTTVFEQVKENLIDLYSVIKRQSRMAEMLTV